MLERKFFICVYHTLCFCLGQKWIGIFKKGIRDTVSYVMARVADLAEEVSVLKARFEAEIAILPNELANSC